MKEIWQKLLKVKSMVTLTMTVVFAFLALTGKISEAQVMTVFTVIVSFYFGTQHEKKDGDK